MYKVAAYITLYKDIDAIEKCLSCLYEQTYPIDKIFIVDNSPKRLDSLVFNNEKIIIDFHPENIAIAEGLNIGINWAIENKYDFLWTFDQDSEPNVDTLEILLSEYEYLAQCDIPVGIIAPTIIEIQTQQILPNAVRKSYRFEPFAPTPSLFHYYREKLYQCDVVITSGSLINLQSAKQIPLPNPDFFIDGVDMDYCLKIGQHGYHVCVTQKAFMKHNFGTYLTTIWKKTPIYIYSSLRYYYINRNHTYIETRLSSKPIDIILSFIHRLTILIKNIVKIILFEPDQKPLKIWASCLGFTHGLIGKLGKTWLP